MNLKRIVCAILIMLSVTFLFSCKEKENNGVPYRGPSEPHLEYIDVQVVGDTLYYSYGSKHFHDFKLYTYDLKHGSDKAEILLEDVEKYYVTDDAVYYIPYTKTSSPKKGYINNHAVIAQNDTQTLIKFSTDRIIYKYDSKTGENKEFLRVPNLLDLRITDDKMYIVYQENYTKGDKDGKFDNQTRVFYSYNIDCVSLENSAVRKNILHQNYTEKEFYETASTEFLAQLPAENVTLQDSFEFVDRYVSFANFDSNADVYLYGIHNGKLYFRYSENLIANIDLNTKVVSDLFEKSNITTAAMNFGEESIIFSYNKRSSNAESLFIEEYTYTGEKVEGKTTEYAIRSDRQHVLVSDDNLRFAYDKYGKPWFFNNSDKLCTVLEGEVKNVHTQYDFDLHPRLLYASDEMIVFEVFKNRTTPIRMEALLKDGTVIKIPITWIGIYPPADQNNYATPYGNI